MLIRKEQPGQRECSRTCQVLQAKQKMRPGRYKWPLKEDLNPGKTAESFQAGGNSFLALSTHQRPY